MEPLTKKQKQTLEFIQRFIEKNDYAPSISEIMKKFKLKSNSSAWGRIDWLSRKGYLTKKKDIARSLRIVDNTKQEIIKFVENFNPKIFNHPLRYKTLIKILTEYQYKL